MKYTRFYLCACYALLVVSCGKDQLLNSTGETFRDSRDEHVYKYVIIGTQTWMAENLAYLPAVSPTSEGSDNWACYYVYGYVGKSTSEAKSTVNYTTYGVLYNWQAAVYACPSGWHLPTTVEWTTLENYLGAPPGKKMKSTTGWSQNGNGDNSGGFNAFPGGYRPNGGGYINLGNATEFWTSTVSSTTVAARGLNFNYDGVYHFYNGFSVGISIRCLKD